MTDSTPDSPWSIAFITLKEFGLAVFVCVVMIVVHIYFTKDVLAKNDALSQQLMDQTIAHLEHQKENNAVVLKALTDNTKAFTEMSMTMKSIQNSQRE